MFNDDESTGVARAIADELRTASNSSYSAYGTLTGAYGQAQFLCNGYKRRAKYSIYRLLIPKKEQKLKLKKKKSESIT